MAINVSLNVVVIIFVWQMNLQLSAPITMQVVSSNHVHGEVYSIPQYVIMFVSYLRQIPGFPWVLRFHPPIKLAFTIFKDWLQFFFSSWRNNLNQVVHAVYPVLHKGYFERTEQIISINLYKLIETFFCYDIEKYIYFVKIRQIIGNKFNQPQRCLL